MALDNRDKQIIQQNKILTGGQTINLRPRQIIYALGAFMDKENPTAEIRIPGKAFLDFVNNTPGEKWSDIYELVSYAFDHLNDNPILLKEKKKKDFVKVNWLSRLGVKDGYIIGRFSADFADYIQYKQGLPYTKLLWDLRAYRSKFSARIVELFQMQHDKTSRVAEINFTYPVDDLRLFFGVHDAYPRFYDFEKRVLKVAEKELEQNDTVPYWFSYEKVKAGKVIEGVHFTVYVRSKILLAMIPELTRIGKNKNQLTIFDDANRTPLSETRKAVLKKLSEHGIKENFSMRVLPHLKDSQAIALWYLIEYGVNRSLALTLVLDHCSFGEIEGFEDKYIQFVLQKIEKERLKRIRDFEKGKTKKRITPNDKRGGLPKRVLEERQHFSAFMEHLSAFRAKRQSQPLKPKPEGPQGEMKSIKDIIGRIK